MLFIIPVPALSHPGKTDRYGAHRCLRGCEEWGLLYGEYHTHDKDGKPIRINVAKRTKGTQKSEAVRSEITETNIAPELAKREPILATCATTREQEEIPICADPLVLWLLALLLLLLLLRVRRRRKENESA